jgi:hypothetical protein
MMRARRPELSRGVRDFGKQLERRANASTSLRLKNGCAQDDAGDGCWGQNFLGTMSVVGSGSIGSQAGEG